MLPIKKIPNNTDLCPKNCGSAMILDYMRCHNTTNKDCNNIPIKCTQCYVDCIKKIDFPKV